MKLFIFTDTHGNKKVISSLIKKIQTSNPDIIICAGDLTNLSVGLQKLLNMFEKTNLPLLIIPGNHETNPDLTKACQKTKFAINIHKKIYSVNNYLFFGFGLGGFERKNPELEKLTPKITSEFHIVSEKLQLKGIIDQIEDYGNGVVPIELKTGSCPREGVWPGHRIQAGAYALMLEEMQGKPVGQAVVYYLDGNEKRNIVMNPFMREEIAGLVEEIQELLSNTLLPEYCCSMQKCAACGLRKECYNQTLMQSLLTSVRVPTQRQLLSG